MEDALSRVRYRTIWISDLHLGTRACQADRVLDFLRHSDCHTLYLVGDIVDGWRLQRSWYWPQSHNDVVQELLRKAHNGTDVYFIPGNHDEAARLYLGHTFGGVRITPAIIHQGANGRRFLVTHGDEFDLVVRRAPWLAHLGDRAYTFLLWLNVWVNVVRRALGLTYWSLSACLKYKSKQAVNFLGRFEDALADEARRRGVDGVICGHVHTPSVKAIGDHLYCNTGDWVESCTALVEHETGHIDLVRWAANTTKAGFADTPFQQREAA